VHEILPGIWHWAVFHEPISTDVSSHYVDAAKIVVDPKVPAEGLQAIPGEPQQVVLTTGLHHRDAQRFAEHFGIPIRVSREGAARLGDRLAVQTFVDQEQVAPGATAVRIGSLAPDEYVLHIGIEGGVIAFADALTYYGGNLGFVPDQLLGDDPQRVKAGLLNAFRRLLSRDFDHLLFAHGEPLIGGGKAALREFVDSAGR
jgi:hypothetical protein